MKTPILNTDYDFNKSNHIKKKVLNYRFDLIISENHFAKKCAKS
jgi:hypothetical protein